MATSKIGKQVIQEFKVCSGTSASKEISANNATDWDIQFSSFTCDGVTVPESWKPIGILTFYFSGTGLSQLCVYAVRVYNDSRYVRVSARNRDTSAHTFSLSVTMTFLATS